jgi:hypothetical protein
MKYPKSDPMNYIIKLFLNALYGRFGMQALLTYYYVINKNDYLKFEKQKTDSIIDVIDLGKNYLVSVKNPDAELKTNLDNGFETNNINVAIASAITAYARIHMSQFKNRNDFKLFYSDTDSIYIDKPLPDSYVSNNILGHMKLEKICSKAIFIAPKVYALLTESGDEIIKVKGLSTSVIKEYSINLELISTLLNKNTFLTFPQTKWYKHIDIGRISILDQLYTLQVTGNKRKLIYRNDRLVDTAPFIIDNNKNISY